MFAKTKKIIKIIAGAAVMGFALELFLVPSQIAAGGVGGLATVVYHLTGLPVSLLIFLINIPIFIIGAMNFKMKFLYVSLIGTISLSASSAVFAFLPPITNDIVLAAVFGGAVFGFGLGMVILAGGTTGGTDILALVLRRRLPRFSVGQFFLLIDGLVIALAGLAFRRWDTILYSALTLLISTFVVDTMLDGVDFAKLVYIISDKHKAISEEIYKQVSRGVTGLSAVSYYTGAEKRVLLCVTRKYELPRLKAVIHKVDPNAFLIVSDAKEVHGRGFNETNLHQPKQNDGNTKEASL